MPSNYKCLQCTRVLGQEKYFAVQVGKLLGTIIGIMFNEFMGELH